MRRSLLALVAVVGAACSPRQTNLGDNVDAGPPTTLTVTGRVCTEVVDPSAFPVKLVLLVDQSGASCITDPPGSQESAGLCESVSVVPPNVTQPARVRALNRLLTQLETQPNVQVALVPYETNVRGTWPPTNASVRFGRPNFELRDRVQALQAELGKRSNLQGALAWAHALVTADVAQLEATTPAALPRTRYVVVVLSTGPASPRCSALDNLTTYADDLNPTAVWADSDGDFCNLIDPMDPDAITGFVAGADLNQDGQLLNYATRLRGLQSLSHVGSVELHTRLLYDLDAFAACGAACNDLYGPYAVRWPGPVPVPSVGAWARAQAKSTLERLAARGGGGFVELTSSAALKDFTLDDLDLTPLTSTNEKRVLIPQALRAIASQGTWALDDDADGLSNADEAAATTDPLRPDGDGDGFDDRFEVQHTADGFDPKVADARGCNATLPGCVSSDVDGDGLSQFAEFHLGTSTFFPDTDRDGLPDGLEVRFGLDPLTRLDHAADVDGDGVGDFDEVLRGSDPRVADAAFPGLSVSTTARPLETDGRACYDFTVSGYPMLETPARSDAPAGVGLFKLWFAGAPARAPDDVGTWTAACFFARRDVSQTPPVVVPANLTQNLPTTSFVQPNRAAPAQTGSCAGLEALTP